MFTLPYDLRNVLRRWTRVTFPNCGSSAQAAISQLDRLFTPAAGSPARARGTHATVEFGQSGNHALVAATGANVGVRARTPVASRN